MLSFFHEQQCWKHRSLFFFFLSWALYNSNAGRLTCTEVSRERAGRGHSTLMYRRMRVSTSLEVVCPYTAVSLYLHFWDRHAHSCSVKIHALCLCFFSRLMNPVKPRDEPWIQVNFLDLQAVSHQRQCRKTAEVVPWTTGCLVNLASQATAADERVLVCSQK